jgi:hypothetical protein
MLVPGHVVSLYVATSGLPGAGLGSDEKEIILLVYVIIDVQTTKVSCQHQFLNKRFPIQRYLFLNNIFFLCFSKIIIIIIKKKS